MVSNESTFYAGGQIAPPHVEIGVNRFDLRTKTASLMISRKVPPSHISVASLIC